MNRKPFEGVWNVVRFNWHFYAIVFAIVALILIIFPRFPDFYQALLLTLVFLILMPVLISLFVTFHVYDGTDLYEVSWLDKYEDGSVIASFNAGFDETTKIFRAKKPNSKIIVLDFYDEEKHTEISIKRARKAYPEVPGTLKVETDHLPLDKNSIDLAIGFLSVHEIRDHAERVLFFQKLKEALTDQGEIVLIEHLRDIPNFLTYTIGFLHFLSRKTWLATFTDAGFSILEEERINPLMTKFTLGHGTTT